MLFQQFKLESSRIFGTWRYIIFFTLFFILCITFILSGIYEYNNFLNQKKSFVTYEQKKVDLYSSYDHYHGCGFRILYHPPLLSVFFNNSGVFNNLYSTVNITDSLDVHRSYKGKNLMLKRGFFKDLAGSFFLFGSLFMAFMGLTSYRSEKYFFKFGNIIIRLSILNLIFIILILSWYYFPKLFHMQFSVNESTVFFKFCLYLIIFLSFFYGAGLLIRVLTRNKYNGYIYVFIFWLLSLILVPEAMNLFLQKKSLSLPDNEKYSLTILKELMNFERRVKEAMEGKKTREERNKIYYQMSKNFLDTSCVKTLKIETEINRHIQEVIRDFENTLIFFPTCFYSYLSGEVSGKGYYGYLGFVNYSTTLRCKYIKFRLKNLDESDVGDFHPIIKNDENIFYAPNCLPQSFPIASGLTLFYTMIFLIFSYVLLKRRISRLPEIEKPLYEFRKGNTYFVLCKNDNYRDNLFKCYQADENTIGIDKVKVEEIDPGVRLVHMVTYFCKFAGVEEKKAWENLKRLGIEDDDIKNKFQRRRKQNIPDEVIYKIYCAVIMAGTHEIVVVKDFLKAKSREMEYYFLDLVAHLNTAGKIIVYLSSEIFLTSLPFEGRIKIDNYKSFKIDPQAVSLR